jgi:hypothetical protein
MLNVSLTDKSNGNRAKINGEGELNVVVHPHPPRDEPEASVPFRQYFDTVGDGTGTTDMQVSATTEFMIKADSSGADAKDIYVKTVSFVIADQNSVLNQFGAVTALTNGCLFKWVTLDLGTVIIHEALKSNWDFVRLCQGNPPFGDGTAAFRAGNVAGNSEGYIPVLDTTTTFGIPFGLRLRKNSIDKLSITVRDTTTGVDQFDAIAFGMKF